MLSKLGNLVILPEPQFPQMKNQDECFIGLLWELNNLADRKPFWQYYYFYYSPNFKYILLAFFLICRRNREARIKNK